MAGKTFQYTISAVDKATATIERVNKSIDRITAPYKALARSAKAFSDASGLTKLSKNLGDVAKQADKAARSITKMAAPLLAIVGGGTIAGLSQMVTEWGKIGAETERTSRLLGITANQLTQMRSAASLMGVSADTMTAGFQSLQDTLQDARWGRNQSAFATLQALGVALRTTRNGAIDTKAAMYDLADRVQRVQRRDPAAARNLARSLGVEQLLPVLIRGRDGIRAYEAEAQRLRGEFTPAMAQRAEAFTRSLSRMDEAVDGLKASIADRLFPVLQPLVERLTAWFAKNRELIGQRVAAVVTQIAEKLPAAVTSILDFVDAVTKAVDALGGWKAVAMGGAFYMAGGVMASIASAVGSIGMLAIRVGLLARAWMGAGAAAGTAASAMAGAGAAAGGSAAAGAAAAGAGAAGAAAGRGLLARVVGGFLRFLNPITAAGALGLYSEELGTGEVDTLKRIRAAEAAAGGVWPGATNTLGTGEASSVNARVAAWAQQLDFAALEKRYRLPSGLLAAVAHVESRGNAAAVSPAGATGLFQFTPATAREYGINALDPAQSASAAARKLAGLMSRYQGNLGAALSAYNWGEGNLDRKGMANAPAETRAYAPKVLAAMGGALDSGVPMPPLNAPAPQMAETAPPVVQVTTRVHVERDGRTSVRTETPSGLHVAYPMMSD